MQATEPQTGQSLRDNVQEYCLMPFENVIFMHTEDQNYTLHHNSKRKNIVLWYKVFHIIANGLGELVIFCPSVPPNN